MTSPQLHVLLIEDNPDHATLICDILHRMKEIEQITTLDDGQKALDYIARARVVNRFPDLILLDLKLPKINGFELLKIWKSDPITRDLPIVVISTSDIENDKQRARSLGARDYLVKSPDLHSIRREIRALIDSAATEIPMS